MKQTEFKAFEAVLSSVAEYYRQPLKASSVQFFWNALEPYDLSTVKSLLDKHIRTSKFMPAISELLDTIQGMDGHPGAEVAWAMVSRCLTDERVTVVWTQEMRKAFFQVANLSDDPIAARMSFKESYAALVRESRERNLPVKWEASLGQDPDGREQVLLEAVEKGRLPQQFVAGLLPHRQAPNIMARLIAGSQKTEVEKLNVQSPAPDEKEIRHENRRTANEA